MQRLRLGMLLNTRACTAQPLAISLPGSQASPRPVARKEDEQASPRSSASRERHNLEMGQRKNKKQGQRMSKEYRFYKYKSLPFSFL